MAALSSEVRDRLAREYMEKARVLKTETSEQIEEAIKLLTFAITLKPLFVPALLQRGHHAARLGRYDVAITDFSVAIQLEDSGIDRRRLAATYGSRGSAYRKINKLTESIMDFMRAVEVEPDNGTWLYELGLTYTSQGSRVLAQHFISSSLGDKVAARMTDGVRFRAFASLGACRLSAGDINGAIAVFIKGLEIQETALMHNMLGVAHFLRDEYKMAKQRFQRALELDSTVSEYHVNSAVCFFQLGLYADALRCLEYAVTKGEKLPMYYFYRSNAALMTSLYGQATIDINEAISLEPQQASYYYTKALVYVAEGQYDSAKETLATAVEFSPSFHKAWVHYGLLHFLQRDLFAAIDCFSQALKLEEDDPLVHECMGLVYSDVKYYDLAASSFTRCIALCPNNPLYYFRRGTVLLQYGDSYGAYLDLHEAVCTRNFCEPQVLNSFSVALSRLGKDSAALEYATRAVELNNKNHRYLFQRATCNYAVGNYKAVLEDLESVLHLGHESACLYYLRAQAKYSLRDFAGAFEDLLQAATLMPQLNDCADYCYALGVAGLHTGENIADAEEAFTRAISFHTDPPLKFYNDRAKVRERVGNFVGALEDLNVILRFEQSDPTVLLRRALAHKALGNYEAAAKDFEKAKSLSCANEVLCNVPYEKFFEIEYISWDSEE
uniref:Uncharacterized protein n=1 Tax=Trypanosoma vivax (strain Y486) TaxID=1055687 RepID=G0TXV6_TRYVY|nr:conserved hypothetical protein [Trypanosoma vivax Y486]